MMLSVFWRRVVCGVWLASMAVVTTLSLAPHLELPGAFPGVDKAWHFMAYAWLGLLPRLGFASRRAGTRASLSMILLGMALEVAQIQVPPRTFSWLDMAANALGVACGMAMGGKARGTDSRPSGDTESPPAP